MWCELSDVMPPSRVTHHEAELECAEGKPVDGLVDAAVDGSALAPKAFCVDDASFPPSWHHVEPAAVIKTEN